MKTTRFTLSVVIALLSIVTACKRDVQPRNLANGTPADNTPQDRKVTTGVCDATGYILSLESQTPVGNNWEWVWSIQNTNPGNGNSGTFQDLSHWGMSFGSCFDWNTIVSAAYSSNGTGWTNFTPVYHVDPSQGCYTAAVMKFDFGTSGTAKSYYKLVVNQSYPVVTVPGYYKSGGNTGCCTFNFLGLGCPGQPGELNE